MNSLNKSSSSVLTDMQYQQFMRDGFLKINSFVSEATRQSILKVVEASLKPALGPLEYETDVYYPGSPLSRLSAGGNTPRRLLNAYARDSVFRDWACEPRVVKVLKRLLSTEDIVLTQNHHNCIMTKMPSYSSETHWHQDIRYWSFDQPDLVNAWLALGDEYAENGGMKFIPGSHKMTFNRGQLDADLFLREDLAENKALLASAVELEMKAGDILFFHCNTFHAAGLNATNKAKYSLVFSYHAADNFPIQGTRSARLDSVRVGR